MDPIISIKVSRFQSSTQTVRAAEQALMQCTQRSITLEDGQSCAMIFVIQALQYVCGITRNPWSPNFPSQEQVVETIQKHAPIAIHLY